MATSEERRIVSSAQVHAAAILEDLARAAAAQVNAMLAHRLWLKRP